MTRLVTGVYEIHNKTSGKVYIGSSVNVRNRWRRHRYDLRHGQSRSPHLQAAWNKYGEAAFTFRVLLFCDPDTTLWYEQQALDMIKPFGKDGYNTCREVGKPGSFEMPVEIRERIAAANRGQKRSPEARERMRQAALKRPKRTGMKLSPEHKRHLSEAHMGQPGYWAGKKRPEMARAKLKPYPAFQNKRTGEAIPAGVGWKYLRSKYGLHPAHMSEVARGKLEHYKGWVVNAKAE